MTFINFPVKIEDTNENAHWTDRERKLAMAILDFVWKLKMKVAYVVRRSDEKGNPTEKRFEFYTDTLDDQFS